MPDHGSRAGGRGPSQLAVRVIRELQQLGGKGPLTCVCPCSPRLPCCAEPAASERRPMPDEPWLACSRCCAAAREASRAPASSCPCCSACGAPRGLALDPPPLDPWVCRKAELWSDWQKGQPPSAGQAASQRERERERATEREREREHTSLSMCGAPCAGPGYLKSSAGLTAQVSRTHALSICLQAEGMTRTFVISS